MTKREAIQLWLNDRGYYWCADEILVYADELDVASDSPVITVIGLKPAMEARPHPVWITDDAIYQRVQGFGGPLKSLFIKIDISSPKFFKVLRRAMKGNIRRGQEVK